jgi:mRNA-degrading endonuclease toxin of MazEF toxin-antitoxin module
MEDRSMQPFEKLGAFYLGRVYDLENRRTTEDLLLYDAKDLTTHAVCVGMTGSGKTGLCLSLLEEAAIDGIPAIAIDVKGDLGNLLLTFPELRPSDFVPWLDEGEAARKGMSPEVYAAQTAETWRKGLADWGQDKARVARFRESADLAIYTPGSRAGLPLSVLRSFTAPPASLLEDGDAITSQSQRAGFPLSLEIESRRLPKRSWVKISQIRTLSVERIGRRIGRLSPEQLDQVIEGLNEIIGS